MDPADSRLVGFKHHLRAATVPAEAVYLISERGVTALSGSCIERLAPLLDGTRSVAQLTREVSADVAAAQVGAVIEQLSEAGLLDLRQPPAARPPLPGAAGPRATSTAAFWSLAGLDADEAAWAVGAATVEIVTLDGTDAAAVAAVCAESGLACDDTAADISLVLCEDYLDARLQAVNARHLSGGRPWLLARTAGAQAWIGPLFRPGAGPCWACLARRLEGNRDEAHLVRRALGGWPAAPQASLPASRSAALRLAIGEVAKWLAGIRSEGQRAIYIFDTVSLRGHHHAVHARPQCASCGTPQLAAERASQPPALAARPAHGGQLSDPARVLAEYAHLVDPVTGIVAGLQRDESAPEFQHAYTSGRNRAMAASTVAGIKAGSRHPSGGRGVTEEEARAGALCEAVERYCGTRQGDEPTVRGSLASLGGQALHPGACLLFDQRQFDDRTRWNAACAPFHRVPEPFGDEVVTDWTPVWSLLTGEQKLLPTAMLYYNPGSEPGPSGVLADSNGSAAGASLDDAIVRGFLELAERDAVALWWYNRTRQPAVGLSSFEDSWITGLPERYRRLGRELWVLDATSDLGIPVMVAISRRTDQPAEDIVLGFGAHFDPRIALRRALTELGQLLPRTAPAAAGCGSYRRDDPHLVSWWTRATTGNQPYLLPRPGLAARGAADYGCETAGSASLDAICAVVRRAGLDILVLDQTRPDIRMPVVKVVVPGMRHFWPRFAPGRLFDVPVRLGRLVRPTRYSDLNPTPLYT